MFTTAAVRLQLPSNAALGAQTVLWSQHMIIDALVSREEFLQVVWVPQVPLQVMNSVYWDKLRDDCTEIQSDNRAESRSP